MNMGKTTASEAPKLPTPTLGSHVWLQAIVDSDLLPHDTFLVRQGDKGSTRMLRRRVFYANVS